ncbi:MAG: ankyrin repeat domain-containing protein [Gammaproteobacteria bacterium]|nr:ankyrin repeat domain-containing protein [Gammaproteobacteria bacterium]
MQASLTLSGAAGNGDIASVAYFINSGAALDRRDGDGWSPLMLACVHKRKAVADLLLGQKACQEGINIPNHYGCIVLHYAAMYGWLDMVKRLIDLGSALDSRDSRGESPSMLASASKHKAVVDLLLGQEACQEGINIPDHSGQIALHYAAKNGWIDTIELLIDLGSALNSEDSIGNSPFMLAFLFSKFKVMELLLKCGSSCDLQVDGTRQSNINTLIAAGRADICLELIVREKDPAKKANLQTMLNKTGISEAIIAARAVNVRLADGAWGRKAFAISFFDAINNAMSKDLIAPSARAGE